MIRRFIKRNLSEEERKALSDHQHNAVKELINSGDHQGAVWLTKKFQKKFPTNKKAICNSAIELSDAGEVEASIEILQKLNKKNPSDSLILINIAVCYNRVEEYERQLEVAQEAYAADPDKYEAAEYLSDVLYEFDLIDEAKQICEDFLSRSSEHQSLWFRIGCCEMYYGNSEDALSAFKQSLELDPDHFNSLANCAAAQVGLKEWDDAEELVLRALEIRPEDGVTLCNLAQIYEAQNRDEDAYQMYLRATKVDPEYERAYEDVQRMRELLGLSDEHSG